MAQTTLPHRGDGGRGVIQVEALEAHRLQHP